jgi:hypothetical protein
MSHHNKNWTPLPPGTVVRHQGQQYSAAKNGTAVIVRHYWNGLRLEYIVAPLDHVKSSAYFDRPGREGCWSADRTVDCRHLALDAPVVTADRR